MNPTPTRIEDVFALHDPNHYYWGNLYKFMTGNSYKAREELFKHPFKPELKGLLLWMTEGITAEKWYAYPPDKRNLAVMEVLQISNNIGMETRTLLPLTEARFEVLGALWQNIGPEQKHEMWTRSWSHGLNADAPGTQFMQTCMAQWSCVSITETQWKVKSLLSTMLNLGHGMRGVASDEDTNNFDHYEGILIKELHAMAGRWPVDLLSVQIWEGLLQLPDFQKETGFPHPWMLSLCEAYRQDARPASASPMYFVFKSAGFSTMRSLQIPAPNLVNPLNPLDHLLAKALHTMNVSHPVVTPEVQGIFGLLQGTDNLMGGVLSLGYPGEVHDAMNSTLFEYQP